MADNPEVDLFGFGVDTGDICVVHTPTYADNLSTLTSTFSWRSLTAAKALVDAVTERATAANIGGASVYLTNLPAPAADESANSAGDWAAMQTLWTSAEIFQNAIPDDWNDADSNYKSFAEHWDANGLGTAAERFENFCHTVGAPLSDGTNWGFRYSVRNESDEIELNYPNSTRVCSEDDLHLIGMPALIEDLEAALSALVQFKYHDPAAIDPVSGQRFAFSGGLEYTTTASNVDVDGSGEAWETFTGDVADQVAVADDYYESSSAPSTTRPGGYVQTSNQLFLYAVDVIDQLQLEYDSVVHSGRISFECPVAGTYEVMLRASLDAAYDDYSDAGSGFSRLVWTSADSGPAAVGTVQTDHLVTAAPSLIDFPVARCPDFSITAVMDPASVEGNAPLDTTLYCRVYHVADWLGTDVDSINGNQSYLWSGGSGTNTLVKTGLGEGIYTYSCAVSIYAGTDEERTAQASVTVTVNPKPTGTPPP